MGKVLNVALIGCGRVAGHHARSIEKIPEIMNLVAVCDLIEEHAKAIANVHNVPAYTNYYRMLSEHPNIDIVSIITPSGMHYEHAIDIIGRYHKNIVVEKPTFMRPQQMLDAYALAKEKGCRIFLITKKQIIWKSL